jgi:hypothetical protein
MNSNFPAQLDKKQHLVSEVRAERSLLIVGHPMSDYRRVEAVLQGVGMMPAKPTLQQELAPADISAHLLKRAGIAPDFSKKIEQLVPSPIWQILALDLFMGNSDAGFWGWSDPQSIYLLDYWCATDPAMHFVFVYDSLEHVLVRASAGRELSPETISNLVNEWHCFYSALLHFYHRHGDRCLLVHAEQACINPDGFDKALASRLQRPLERDISNSVVSMALDLLEASLAYNLVEDQHAWRCDYEELQSHADFPLVAGRSSNSLAAWNGFSRLTAQIHLQNESLAAAKMQLAETQAQLGISQAEKAQIEASLTEQKQESELLLLQLHQVQEELERYFLENDVVKKALESLKKSLAESQTNAEAQKTKLEQLKLELESYKHDSAKQLEATKAKQSPAPELQKQNELLLRQLRQVQEELERCYLESLRLKQSGNQAKTKMVTDTQSRQPYGAAGRVRGMLSYRLGATMIARSKSFTGWLGMPSALLREARLFNQEKRSRGDRKLPRLSQYADAQEGERVKRHLSYRLGATLLANYKSPVGWVKLPWLMSHQVSEFRRERANK